MVSSWFLESSIARFAARWGRSDLRVSVFCVCIAEIEVVEEKKSRKLSCGIFGKEIRFICFEHEHLWSDYVRVVLAATAGAAAATAAGAGATAAGAGATGLDV